VVHHDPAIPGLGTIAAHDWAAIARHRLPNGEPIPRLAEALEVLDGLYVFVEAKTLPPSSDDRLLQVLTHGPTPHRYAVHSFDHRIILRLGRLQPPFRRGLLSASYVLDPVGMLEAAGATTLWQDWQLIDQDLVTTLHRRNLELLSWTANDEAEIERLARLGVDGICGNYPDRIRRVIERVAA
jgi:glycerophosphoryl diester phosphodiesterase